MAFVSNRNKNVEQPSNNFGYDMTMGSARSRINSVKGKGVHSIKPKDKDKRWRRIRKQQRLHNIVGYYVVSAIARHGLIALYTGLQDRKHRLYTCDVSPIINKDESYMYNDWLQFQQCFVTWSGSV